MADVRWVDCCFSLCIIFELALLIDGERTSNKIYDKLRADTPCFRKLNATQQIGCGSERGGNVGIVHYVANVTDLEWLLDYGPYHPYIAVIDVVYFNRKNLTKMQQSGKVSGVIVISPLNSAGPDAGYSPDHSCPNQQYGVYNECSVKWNPHGDGLFFEDWKFPIFLVQKQEDIDNLIQNCYQQFNAPLDGKARTWPLCAAQLSSNMYAAKDAPTCIRRSNMITNMNPIRVCDPLADFNIWSSLIPLNKSYTPADRSLIVVAARMDSFSMFENIGPGGDSAVSGIVALLATADALASVSKDLEARNISKNVLFMLFHGEAFDYIGSSRIVYDMSRGSFPSKLDDSIPSQPPLISLENIGYFIEFNQVGLSEAVNATVWVHSDPQSTSKYPVVNSTVNDLINILKNESRKLDDINLERSPDSTPLPPASFQRFLKADSRIPGIVLTDHRKHYANRYYNSIFDGHDMKGSGKNNSALYIDRIATMAARSIYKLLTDEESDTLTPRPDLVSDMLDCYLYAGNCTLFNMTSTEATRTFLRPNNTNLYVSVGAHTSGMRVMTYQLMSYLVGDQVNLTESQCYEPKNNSIFTYAWMPGPSVNGTSSGLCVKSTVNLSEALSPAFVIQDYSYDSGMYSTWTESVWEGFQLRIFLKPSLHQEVVTLCIGVLVLLLSLGSVWFLERSSDILFTNTRIVTGGS